MFSSLAVSDFENPARYTLSSQCVKSVEIRQSEDAPYFLLLIEVKANEAQKIYLFSKENVKKIVEFNDAKGMQLMSARVMEPFSSRFIITSDTEVIANSIKESLLNIPGKCGSNAIAN